MKRYIFVLLCVGLSVFSADAQRKEVYTHRTYTTVAGNRHEIHIPQVKGFNVYKGDFHVHTAYSDGQVTPAGRVDEAWRDGLDILAITDHLEGRSGERRFFKVVAPYNKNGKPTRQIVAGSSRMPKNGVDPGIKADFNAIHREAEVQVRSKGYNMLLVKGCEMARNKEKLGHYNALFITDARKVYNYDLKVAFKNAHEQGGIIIHNHPGNINRYNTEWLKEVYSAGMIDGVEVANGYRYYPYMTTRCIKDKLTMFGNTDAHGQTATQYLDNGQLRTMTLVLAKELTEEAIKEAILKRRTIAYSGGDLIGEESWLKELLNASIDCRLVNEDKKEGKRTYRLTNLSSFAYRFRRGKTIYELLPFKSITFSFGKDKKTGKLTAPKLHVENMWVADYKHPTIEFEIDK